jgi:hypothetical protein
MASTVTLTTPPKPKKSALQRAMEVHELPGEFVSAKASVEVTKEEVPNVPGAYVLKNVLTPAECKAFIDACEAIEFTEAPISTGLNSAVMRTDIRDNKRVMATISEKSLAAIQSRIKAFIDQDIDGNGFHWKALDGASGLNERLRFYKYEEGQEFKPHFDGCFPRSEEESSFFTFIIYLNGDLNGGQTAFFMDHNVEQLVNPEVGQALVFWHRGPHSPYHAGLPHFSKGQCKYVLRSDLMYKRGEALPKKPAKK